MIQSTATGYRKKDLTEEDAPDSTRSTAPNDTFARRHVGPGDRDLAAMLEVVGVQSLDELVEQTVPASIRSDRPLHLAGLPDRPRGEFELVEELFRIAARNRVFRSCIGMGYYDTITPPVIQRNILENPGWYTQYTPYQAEISQGRLEALINFQTMVAELTGLPLANASLLDEATAAAEAMAMCLRIARGRKNGFFVVSDCHPQTIAVVRTRARSLGVDLHVGDLDSIDFESQELCGLLVQYPATDGRIRDVRVYGDLAERAHDSGALLVVATDLMALTLVRPPGELSPQGKSGGGSGGESGRKSGGAGGADIAIGSAQRFGVPMGYGGPHAAFMATRDEHARKMPGRIVGVSRDVHGNQAYRLAIQTREQHIKRDRATSNICTAQVLLAIMASMYAVYHGPDGLRRIAGRIHRLTNILAAGLKRLGHDVGSDAFFDTLKVDVGEGRAAAVLAAAEDRGINLRRYDDRFVGVSLDETSDESLVADLLVAFGMGGQDSFNLNDLAAEAHAQYGASPPDTVARQTPCLTHPVFDRYHSETELLRYLFRLQALDISLARSMIPLGSCTMKLNGTTLMLPMTWLQFGRMHPYAPPDQARGYARLFEQLESWLADMTGLSSVSLQPNAGSQGEYAGLLAIRAYHESRGDADRSVCLIPVSAHGTNPASAVIAGFEVAAVDCDRDGNIEVEGLKAKADQHRDRIGALMITYPSTHGVFEEAVKEICRIVHEHGGQVYMDGANMNAQVGLCRPGEIGADVCHLNLHKTFCIPHGGGGPGMGPIAVAEHLARFLPSAPLAEDHDAAPVGAVAAAPYGSPSILPISWLYIALMGSDGLTRATEAAILNANYMARRLQDHYPVLYTGRNGRVAHEFVLDCRQFHVSAAVEVEDIAKRLMDYGFHAPTMSWPVAGTLMIEPTESESKAELDRFCDALISIRQEIRAIEQARADLKDNPLKHAPHTAEAVTANVWSHPYSREQGAYPEPWVREHKYWPPVGRIDNPYGDRHLVCTCP